ncbi:F-box only protein 6-like [Eucyclogobius newberryi]|uniref:F-box only protein 6-like n=1 Tax=Eucyclogobius newberryi TaxID=166745 RepID=UPI003B5C673A
MSLADPIKKKRKVMGAAPSSSSSLVPANESPSIDSLLELPVHSVPLEIVEEIFHNLPHDRVIQHCRLVCKQWKEVVDSESLWRERCRREGLLPRDVTRTPDDWRMYYVLCKKRRNLLKNPKAEGKFKYWRILENGGDRWKIEDVMEQHPNANVQKNFVTSYQMCLMSQEINLTSEGYNSSFMDRFQPPIKITDWYAARWDCACKYIIKVELLDENKRCLQKFEPAAVDLDQGENQWYQTTHVFTNYGPGVRYLNFVHGGKDRQFWAGWYGVRVTDSSVEVCPEV